MRKKVLWLTQTAALLALLVLLQGITKPAGQFVTGSAVNGVLAVAALLCGIGSGLTVAVLSPWLAFLLGIGPQLIPVIPAICLGNVVYVLILGALLKEAPLWRKIAGGVLAAICKAGVLYLVVVKLLCSILPLKPPQIETFTAMFSWPQLVTALAGVALALLICPAVQRAMRNRR